MFERRLALPLDSQDSLFLFGPRGTGKTYWLRHHLPEAIMINLLQFSTYKKLASAPDELVDYISPDYQGFIVIDEVQRIPELLNVVHYLIEERGWRFILTGSSSRKLKREGVNLLAGRAIRYHMHPLIPEEMSDLFSLTKALQIGLLPKAYRSDDPHGYLETYIGVYIREEVFQEALVRDMQSFSAFIEIASFSQGQPINMTAIAKEIGTSRQVVANYFSILEDLLLAVKIPIFTKRAKRDLKRHPKFYYFDVGVYRTLRPKGPLDSIEEIDGACLETLFLQIARALNDYHHLGYQFYYWQTKTHLEVDFVLYGDKGLHAFEIKRTKIITPKILRGLKTFKQDYPQAQCYLLYGGSDKLYRDGIQLIPFAKAVTELLSLIG